MIDGLFDHGAILAERRKTQRRRALKGAHLRFNRGYGAYEAIVRDLTDDGARLRFGDVVDVPATFDVRIGTDEAWRPATVRWRSGHDIGVAFAQ
ncbi:MAG: hypothetical protein MUC58_13100 [Rhizobiaceae bacterium]|jgi:hypothetical protein|nr:hypothetical protein [Rhizobiaceae bacterium]